MKRVKIITGIIWAFLCLILIIILFPGLNFFSSSMAKMPFMKINPNYTGGEIAHEIVMESCTLGIRKPVFDGLFGERKRGFLQVDWRGKIPEEINDTIDYNSDGSPDFIIMINPDEPDTDLSVLNPKVKRKDVSTPTSYGWAVRIKIEK